MINTTGMEGFTGRVNVTHKSKDGKMQMGANISFSKQKSEMASEGTAYANAYFVKNWYAIPNLPIYNEDGSFYEGFPLDQLNVPNPLRDQGLDKNTSEVLRSTNSLWASYKIIEGLTIKETISYDFIDNQSTTYWPMNSNNGEAYNGLMIKYPYQHHNIYSSTVLNYTNTFADKHNLDVLLGWDVDDRKEQFVQAVGANYPHDKLPELGNTSEPMTASSGYSEDQPGSAPTTIPNPDLGWEKNENFNIGFDARLFGRLSVAFDFYNRETKDLLQDVPVSMTTGFNNTLKNVGAMNNRGIELDMNYDVFNETAVKWSTGIVLSHNKNKISKLYGGKDIISGTSILREGESYYSWWSREWAGVDPQTGEEQWVLNTENEDGTINRGLTKDPSQAQRVIIGKPDPKVTGGWRNNLSWKGLDLSALFSFSLGGHIMDDPALLYTDTDGETAYQSIGIQQLDRWQKPGDITDVPRRINSYQYARYGSSRHMKSSNHLRLKTVTLSYNLPSKWMQAAGMRNVRIFASGNNLLTWAAYKNIDPEQPVNGVATWALPNLKSVTFGIEIGL